MDEHAQRLVYILLLFTITTHASSFDLELSDYFDDKDVPENIRTYLATFENRILQAIDTEFKRQLTMIRARIDYRIPSLLDLTLTDKIYSGFINKAVADAMVKRVESLEEEVVLLHDHLEGNMTQLDEVKAKLQESENNLQSINAKISSASSTSTAAIRRLNSKMKTVQSALSTMDSKVRGINLTLNKTQSNIRSTADSIRIQDTNLLRIRDLCNITNMTLEEMTTEVAVIQSTINDITGVNLTDNRRDIHDLDAKMIRIGENTMNVTLDMNLLKVQFASLKTTFHDMISDVEKNNDRLNTMDGKMTGEVLGLIHLVSNNTGAVRDIKREIGVLRDNSTMTSNNVREVQTQLLNFGERVNKMSSLATDNTPEIINATKFQLESAMQNVTKLASNVTKNAQEMKRISNKLNMTQSRLSSFSSQLITVESGMRSLRKDIKFEVRLSSASETISTDSILKFNEVKYNAGNGYNNTTGHFRAPVAGSYLFWVNVLMYEASKSFIVELNKNGIRIAAGAAVTPPGARYDTISIAAATELEVGDKILFKKKSGSANKVFGHKFSGYGGILIRPK